MTSLLRKINPGILSRYIINEIFFFFFTSLFAFTSILLTVRMLKFAGLIINKGVAASQIATVFLSIIPTFLEIAIPLAALLGVMLALARLSGDSEITVIRASGVSFPQLLSPILISGFILFIFGAFVSGYLKPWGYKTLNSTLFEIARTKSTAGLESGVFNKLGKLTLYSESIDDKSGDLVKVLVDDKRDELTRKIVIAQSGKILSDVERRDIIFFLEDGYIHEFIDGKYIITKFTSNSIRLDADEIYNSDITTRGLSPKEMNSKELRTSINDFRDAKQRLKNGEELERSGLPIDIQKQMLNAEINEKELSRRMRKLKIESYLRWSMPAAALILALVAMPLGVQPPRVQRTWGPGFSAIIGIFAFIIYYGLLSVGITFSEGGYIHPYIAAWLPNLIALLVAWFFIHKLSTEKWSSVVEGVQLNLEKLKIKLISYKRSV